MEMRSWLMILKVAADLWEWYKSVHCRGTAWKDSGKRGLEVEKTCGTEGSAGFLLNEEELLSHGYVVLNFSAILSWIISDFFMSPNTPTRTPTSVELSVNLFIFIVILVPSCIMPLISPPK